MTTQTKYVVTLVAFAALTSYGAYEILRALFDPIIRSLGA